MDSHISMDEVETAALWRSVLESPLGEMLPEKYRWKARQRTQQFCSLCAQLATPAKPWLWEQCPHQRDMPTPPYDDAAAMALLRVMLGPANEDEWDIIFERGGQSIQFESHLTGTRSFLAEDPAHAILLAAGEYVKAEREKKGE